MTVAPLDVPSLGRAAEPALHVLLGVGFGVVLERAGFGSAKKLTNQFYLNDMTVLKVMFTAIITAMTLVLAATTFGLLDFEAVWVNPTYLGSGIVGGLLFGVGFVVGGYCPGTALVAAATAKLDGLLFVLGVMGGILLFGYTEPLVDGFWNHSGSYGRLTLHEWLGLPMPVAVLLALGLALAFFAGGELVERWMTGTARPRGLRPAYLGAAGLVGTAAFLAALWPVTEPLRSRELAARAEQAIAAGQVQIDALELAALMRERTLALEILDLRDEAAFQRFHLRDARRVEGDVVAAARGPRQNVVRVLVAAEEATALDAYRELARARIEHVYVLAGGLPAWTALFAPGELPPRLGALGDLHPLSRPPVLPPGAPAPTFVARVKRLDGGAKKASGGCGG